MTSTEMHGHAGRAHVAAMTTARQGRFVLSTLAYPFVADQAAKHGGPGQAPGAAELFLGSLLACAFGIMQRTARERGSAASAFQAEASYALAPDDRTRFAVIEIAFTVTGVAQDEAEALVAAFLAQCPIYNTAARTTPTKITTSVA